MKPIAGILAIVCLLAIIMGSAERVAYHTTNSAASTTYHLECYSQGKMFYAGWGKDLTYNGEYVTFIDQHKGSKKTIKGDCIITEHKEKNVGT